MASLRGPSPATWRYSSGGGGTGCAVGPARAVSYTHLDVYKRQAMNNLAYLLAQTGDSLDEALKLARKAVSQAPNNPAFLDTLGYVYLKRDQNDDALDIFDHLIRKYPDDPACAYHTGMAWYQKGDRARAKTLLAHALELRPSKAVSYTHLDVYKRQAIARRARDISSQDSSRKQRPRVHRGAAVQVQAGRCVGLKISLVHQACRRKNSAGLEWLGAGRTGKIDALALGSKIHLGLAIGYAHQHCRN